MALDFDGIDDTCRIGVPVVTAYPFTISAWFNCDDITVTAGIVGISDEATDNERWSLRAAGGITGDPISFRSVALGTGVNANTTTGYLAGVWNHACAVGRSATSRDAYLNGGGKGSNATSNTPAGLDNTSIGYSDRLTDIEFFPGLIAEICIWNIALSDNDILLLALNIHPFELRPNNIVGYWPLFDRNFPGHDLSRHNRHMVIAGAFPGEHAPAQAAYWRKPRPVIGALAPLAQFRPLPIFALQAVNRAGTY